VILPVIRRFKPRERVPARIRSSQLSPPSHIPLRPWAGDVTLGAPIRGRPAEQQQQQQRAAERALSLPVSRLAKRGEDDLSRVHR